MALSIPLHRVTEIKSIYYSISNSLKYFHILKQNAGETSYHLVLSTFGMTFLNSFRRVYSFRKNNQ